MKQMEPQASSIALNKAYSIRHSSSGPQLRIPPPQVSILMSLLSFTTPSTPQHKGEQPPCLYHHKENVRLYPALMHKTDATAIS